MMTGLIQPHIYESNILLSLEGKSEIFSNYFGMPLDAWKFSSIFWNSRRECTKSYLGECTYMYKCIFFINHYTVIIIILYQPYHNRLTTNTFIIAIISYVLLENSNKNSFPLSISFCHIYNIQFPCRGRHASYPVFLFFCSY